MDTRFGSPEQVTDPQVALAEQLMLAQLAINGEMTRNGLLNVGYEDPANRPSADDRVRALLRLYYSKRIRRVSQLQLRPGAELPDFMDAFEENPDYQSEDTYGVPPGFPRPRPVPQPEPSPTPSPTPMPRPMPRQPEDLDLAA